MPGSPRPRIIACAHHKAGASYTVKIFRALARAFSLKLWLKFYEPIEPEIGWDICVHQHGRVVDLLQSHSFVGWHCIRHPKALIYSAALYHQKCAEPWVDIPLERFNAATFWAVSHGETYNVVKDPSVPLEEKVRIMSKGLDCSAGPSHDYFDLGYDLGGATYREFLRALPTLEEKVVFEMSAYSRGVINDMLAFPADGRFTTIKLEDISFDTSMVSLRHAMSKLEFSDGELQQVLDICSTHCLWKIGKSSIGAHATTGMAEYWRDIFTGQTEDAYQKLFSGAEAALGY